MNRYDMRCIVRTIRENLACTQLASMKHVEDCRCEPNIVIQHRQVIVINKPTGNNDFCVCGVPQHKGMCRDAILQNNGRTPPKWKA